jgi:hypothetical protein
MSEMTRTAPPGGSEHDLPGPLGLLRRAMHDPNSVRSRTDTMMARLSACASCRLAELELAAQAPSPK